MIDLAQTKLVLKDCVDLVDHLDGLDHQDSGDNRGPAAEREARVRNSRDLQMLADRLRLAAGLVMNEYWYARGETDPMYPSRDD